MDRAGGIRWRLHRLAHHAVVDEVTLGQTLILLYLAWFLAGWLVVWLIDERMDDVGGLVLILGPLVFLLFIGLPPRPADYHDRRHRLPPRP